MVVRVVCGGVFRCVHMCVYVCSGACVRVVGGAWSVVVLTGRLSVWWSRSVCVHVCGGADIKARSSHLNQHVNQNASRQRQRKSTCARAFRRPCGCSCVRVQKDTNEKRNK